MCVLALILSGDGLTVAANRDEAYARPSDPPQELESGIVGGRDREKGGTWMGIHRSGDFVAITNRSAPAPSADSYSRGLLAREALRCRKPG